MRDNWQKLGEITAKITDKLAPVPFEVTLSGPLAEAVRSEAEKTGNRPETLIAEAVRSYLGDAA